MSTTPRPRPVLRCLCAAARAALAAAAVCLLVPAPRAQAAPTVHLAAAGLASVRSDGAGPGVAGRLIFEGEHIGLEGGVRESAVNVIDDLGGGGLAASDGRVVGNIHLVGRVPIGPVVLRAGLAHNHETPAPLVQKDPAGTTAGTAAGIEHLSGLELGLEGVVPLHRLSARTAGWGRWTERAALTAGVAGDWMPGASSAAWTTQLELGLRVRLGRAEGSAPQTGG